MVPGTVGSHHHAVIGDAIIAGVACVMYGTMGIFGAARYGQQTEGDCLVNTWLGGRKEGWIDLAMAFYLSISIPPMQVCCIVLNHALSSITGLGPLGNGFEKHSAYAACCLIVLLCICSHQSDLWLAVAEVLNMQVCQQI